MVTPKGKAVGALFVTDATEQLSAVVAVPNTTPVAVQAVFVVAVTFAGAVIVGKTLSTTDTVCVAVLIFPAPSVTVQVTVVEPAGKVVGALFVTEATEQLSAVMGVPKTTPVAEVQPVAITLAGAVMVGKTLSVTVTVCVAVFIFPAPSVTVQVTVVTPKGKAVGALFVVEATEQLSAVMGVPNATPVAVQAVLIVAVTLAGAVIVGKTLSVTVTV